MEVGHEHFMRRAIELAQRGVESNDGGPFGCVVVRDGEIIGEGWNQVTSSNDPTAHAEIVAIRDACSRLDAFQLEGCTIYTSCEPCPMCLGAIYWARPEAIYIAADRQDAAEAGFDDSLIYDELEKPNESRRLRMQPLLRDEALVVFRNWVEKPDKTEY
jgi:tRNA(Arg) A34 adenosine deaminase TadA